MPRDGIPGMGVPLELGICVTTLKGVTDFPRDYVAQKGRRRFFFWSLPFLDGIRCTLRVHLGTMSQ